MNTIRELYLTNFRTFAELEIKFLSGITIFVGKNGVGKTNLLESVATVHQGRSPRTFKEKRMIRSDQRRMTIEAVIDRSDIVHTHKVTLDQSAGKKLEVDSSPETSVGSYARFAPVSVFLPEKLLAIRGAAARRRAIIDRHMIEMNPAIDGIIKDYESALRNRNNLLRRAKAGHNVLEMIETWSSLVAKNGDIIRTQRESAISELNDVYEEELDRLTGMKAGKLELNIRGSGDLEKDLKENISAEIRRGSTLSGSHLDDILPSVDGRSLRDWGSAGEQRSALLAWTFAENQIVRRKLGLYPTLLLDEPYSELDVSRRKRLTERISQHHQCIITATETPNHYGSIEERSISIFEVHPGVVNEVSLENV